MYACPGCSSILCSVNTNVMSGCWTSTKGPARGHKTTQQVGFEPATSWSQVRHSTKWATVLRKDNLCLIITDTDMQSAMISKLPVSYQIFPETLLCFCVDTLSPSHYFSVMSGCFHVFLGQTSTEQSITYLAQWHNTTSDPSTSSNTLPRVHCASLYCDDKFMYTRAKKENHPELCIRFF